MVEGQVLLRIGTTFIITGYFLAESHNGFHDLALPRARPHLHAHAKMDSRIIGGYSQEEPPIPFQEEKNQWPPKRKLD